MAAFVAQSPTYRLTASGTSQTLAVPPDCYQYMAWTRGANPVFLKFAKGTAIAATIDSAGSNGSTIPPGAVMTLTKADADQMTYITDVNPSVFYIQFGTGE